MIAWPGAPDNVFGMSFLELRQYDAGKHARPGVAVGLAVAQQIFGDQRRTHVASDTPTTAGRGSRCDNYFPAHRCAQSASTEASAASTLAGCSASSSFNLPELIAASMTARSGSHSR